MTGRCSCPQRPGRSSPPGEPAELLLNHSRRAASHGSEWLSAGTPAGCPPFPTSLLASPCLAFYRTSPPVPSNESCSFVFMRRVGVCRDRRSVHAGTFSPGPLHRPGRQAAPRSNPARVPSLLTAKRFPILQKGKSRLEGVRWRSKGKGGGEKSWASWPPPPALLLPSAPDCSSRGPFSSGTACHAGTPSHSGRTVGLCR